MTSCLERIREIIGNEAVSGLDDDIIKNILWDHYFNLDTVLSLLYEEQDRRASAKSCIRFSTMLLLPPVLDPVYGADYAVNETRNRKVHVIPIFPASTLHIQELNMFAISVQLGSDGSPLSYEGAEMVHDVPQYVAGPTGYEYYDGDLERPRVPLIVLAQQGQHPGYYPGGYPDEADSDDVPLGLMSPSSRLSTITEITERTEPSRHWPSKQQLVALNQARASTATDTTTTYGQVIDTQTRSPVAAEHHEALTDPNFIPPSPSPSAVRRLSNYEAAPSLATSQSHSDMQTEIQTERAISHAKSRSTRAPPMDTLPDISDFQSKVSEKSLPPKPPAGAGTPKLSKLSMLASSRASSRTSRSSDLDTTSVLTYPALRPTAESRLSFATTAATTKPPPSEKTLPKAPSTTTSSMSLHVKQAIKTALELEAHDRERAAKSSPKKGESSVTSTSSVSTVKPTVLTSPPRAGTIPNVVRAESETKARPQSKLAALAQAKAGANTSLVPKFSKSPPSSPPKELPKPHTQYFTPIANGATATTAITTSYQSLQSLSVPQTQDPGPLVQMPGAEPKQSKLSMKIKKASEKPPPHSTPTEHDDSVTTPSPLFLPKPANPRASPSAFASLLLDDHLTSPSPEDTDSPTAHKYGREMPELVKMYEASHSQSRSTLSLSSDQHKSSRPKAAPPEMTVPSRFAFDVPSPDDIVFNAPAKEREKAEKAAQKKAAQTPSSSGYTTPISQAMSAVNTPSSKTSKKTGSGAKKSGTMTPRGTGGLDARLLDMAALNLLSKEDESPRPADEPPPKVALERGKLLQEVRKVLEAQRAGDKKAVSLVVIGHVDAGKSTLMGRLLYELGRVDEKTRIANERGSSKAGKSSFSWAWELDGTIEERERGITMDIALQSLSTPHRQVTILDAPGHKDFIPNMISGASQADCALLVVDASTGEFEAGFDRGGQTREHLLLVRSLGVSQVIVAINKLDQVNWDQSRFEDICESLRAFLIQSGYPSSKTSFAPVSAMLGVNLVDRTDPDASELSKWYKGPTLVDLFDKLEPPARDIASPLRMPISNVFKGQSSGTGVTGRICGGIVQVGERLRVLPGDESALVRLIDVEEQSVPWAAAGTNATLYLTSIDSIHLSIGSVLCPPSDIVPLATVFTARIIVFDIQLPITTGASIELFHHSRDVPATISKLIATVDRASGVVTKKSPRVLTKGISAEVEISLRVGTLSSPTPSARPIPLEPFSVNKDMGRILVRRGGETISAGIVLDIIS
ncbi:hypothetical protein AZE42_04847 [Rhizopogon vesiculosus]|uniref:Elongation factor 1 alpha-like protein n=1 Tax=Rhizopogon vesiculosus TaxID=180088 RepID=A0A1J8QQD6_9AGAM|nr:hypothetical protein AZE42_04847 [Rhizopogon vesiculosus]